jgi:hypothetical protein
MSNQWKSKFIMETMVFKVSGKVMAKFRQNPNLDRKVESARNSDSANRSSFRQS